VGVFLISGVDSSLVAAVLSRHHGEIRTFTIGFDAPGYDESVDARKIAAHLGTRHSDAILRPEKARQIFENLYDVYDEPHGDSSCIPTTFVSELAKEAGVKVVLSADGGDELFGGYSRYFDFTRRWEQLAKLGPAGRGAARLLCAAAGSTARGARGEKARRFADILGQDSRTGFLQSILRPLAPADYRTLLPDFQPRTERDVGPPGLMPYMAEWDFNHYLADDILVKVDRATMYHSIEGREPFLDHRLIEFAAQLPQRHKVRGSEGKYLLKRLLGRYLPEELYRLPKRGFAAPWAAWTRDVYQPHFLRVLDEGVCEPFSKKGVEQLLTRYRRGEPIEYTVLWYVFSYHAWYRQWMR
jgi:asparagine synthase (glutamine-hydrolysing)